MIFRELGNTGINVSVIAYGGLALGKNRWNGSTSNEIEKCLEASFTGGVNFFDTSPFYGNGKSEEILGNIFSGNRNNIIIGSKFGVRLENGINIVNDCSKKSILNEVEGSLKRLKTDYIDLYQLHWYDEKTSLAKIASTINDLKRSGIIKAFGVCHSEIEFVQNLAKEMKIDVVQSVYNLLQNDAEKEIIPFCRENKVGFIANTPFAQGILSGGVIKNTKYKDHDPRNYSMLYNDEKTFNTVLSYINGLEKPVNRTALNYILKRPEISSIVLSLNKMKYIEENLKIIDLIKN